MKSLSFIRCCAIRTAVIVLSALLPGACAVGPDYREPPLVDTGSSWTQPADFAETQVDLSAWWTSLGDPVLDRRVTTALSDNLDLHKAEARIREPRASTT